jgi:hypothetical protein
MNIPGFTAELALAKSRFEVNWASPEETRLGGMWISGRIDVSRSIAPAAMDPKQQAYKECLAECRFEGGALQDCKNQCKAEVFPPVGHGTAPGTSDAQAACCMATFAACIAGAWGSPFGMIGCMYAATSCTTVGLCSGL